MLVSATLNNTMFRCYAPMIKLCTVTNDIDKMSEREENMVVVYVYILDTLADWEIGYLTAELHSRRFFKKDAGEVQLKYVGNTRKPITTMGGVSIMPDCDVSEIIMDRKSVLLLPGADTWNDSCNDRILEIAKKLIEMGATVGAICGATAALAKKGILDNRHHTSNGAGFLDMFVTEYRGQNYYVECLSYADNNLITAGSAGGLMWAKQIIERLDVFETEALNAWYDFFRTGEAQHFFRLMQAVEGSRE